MRIVFMGTPDFAVGVLKSLLQHQYNVVGVITAPDKPSGRGRKMNQSAVKKYALEQQIAILQPTNLKDKNFIEALKLWDANLQIVVAFRMLPKAVWQLPALGTFNLHASLLPHYRGAAPINWSIINGETKTGVTTFFIDEKIDTGEIILQKEVLINTTDTAGSLHDKLMEVGSELVIQTVKCIQEGTAKTIKQPDVVGKPAPKIYKDTCKIDWQQPIDTIYNKIRGLNPYPGAWTLLDNAGEQIEAKIFNATKEVTHHHYNTGKLIPSKKELKVAVHDGYISIDEIQLPGKRKMKVVDLLNGFTFYKGAKMH